MGQAVAAGTDLAPGSVVVHDAADVAAVMADADVDGSVRGRLGPHPVVRAMVASDLSTGVTAKIKIIFFLVLLEW